MGRDLVHKEEGHYEISNPVFREWLVKIDRA